MKSTAFIAVCLFGMLSLASCNSGNGEQEAEGTATVAGADAALTEENEELLAFAARNNMLLIRLGQLGAEKASTDNLKQYSQQMVTWYETKQQELQELAQQYNITLPANLEEKQTEYLDELQKTEADEFEEGFWDTMGDAQQEALEKYRDNLADVEEANMNAFTLWARSTQKELQAQMEKAKAMELEAENTEGGISNSL
ncbi:DUF4142 domain-containing protein [Pontibacter sp. CAU 1760]